MTFERIAVVKRRGCDVWPCAPGVGAPVCRVGGKLHSMGKLQAGSQQEKDWHSCEPLRLTCVICRQLFELHELTSAHACSYQCLACAEETERILLDDEWWATNGPRE